MSAVGDYEVVEVVLGPFTGQGGSIDPASGAISAPEGKVFLGASTKTDGRLDYALVALDGRSIEWGFQPARVWEENYITVRATAARMGC